jgi:RNA polymerase sigma-70 factor (ECF subfamily)
MEPSERTLIDRFKRGDREAFGQIVRHWDHRVLNLAYRLTGDLEEALDIRQMTFLRALKGLPSFNGEARISTWLYRIVVNLSRDRTRAHRVREAALRVIQIRPQVEKVPPPDREPERRELARRVADAVAGLSRKEREVVVLKHYHGRSYSEIATILRTPASTVKSRMERGLRNLRVRLKNLEP